MRAVIRKRGLSFPVILALAGLLGIAVSSHAVTNGQPDGTGHPFVGAVNNEEVFCSGAAISPKIFVTAAHCFNYPEEVVYVTFDPEPFAPGGNPKYYTGKWHPHPDYCLGCGPGLAHFDSNDVAVVVLEENVDFTEFAELPTVGLVDTLPMRTEVTVVGYGAQFFINGGGPRQPAYLLERYFALTQLIASKDRISKEFIKLTQNPAKGKGGTCFGDSGGPALLGNTRTILAVDSFATNYNCTGVGYSNRIDTESALNFIGSFLDGQY